VIIWQCSSSIVSLIAACWKRLVRGYVIFIWLAVSVSLALLPLSVFHARKDSSIWGNTSQFLQLGQHCLVAMFFWVFATVCYFILTTMRGFHWQWTFLWSFNVDLFYWSCFSMFKRLSSCADFACTSYSSQCHLTTCLNLE